MTWVFELTEDAERDLGGLPKGIEKRFARTLTQMASFGVEDSLFADLGKHEIFTPARDFPPLSIRDIAAGGTLQ